MTFPDLLSIFTWENDEEQRVSDAVSAHIETRAATLAQLAERSGVLADSVGELISMPALAMHDILDAPEMVHFIHRAREGYELELKTFIDDALAAERALSGQSWPNREVWSAKGDSKIEPDGTRWSRARLDGVVVDTRSPRARRPLQTSAYRRTDLGETIPWAPSQDEEDALRKVAESWDALRAGQPNAHTFVRTSLRCLILGRTALDRVIFTSSSSRRYVGRAILLNPDANGVSSEQLVSALVHEAVHSYLYRLEQGVSFVSPDGLKAHPLVSPWSGGQIGLQTYVHACFVYYALVALWSSGSFFEGEAADRKRELERAMKGFIGDAYLDPIQSSFADMPPELSSAIVGLGDMARLQLSLRLR